MSQQKISEIEQIQSILKNKITNFANHSSSANVVAVAEMCKAYAFLEDVRLKNIAQDLAIRSTPQIFPRQTPPDPNWTK